MMAATESETELALADEFTAAFKDGFTKASDYKAVYVLVIYWADGEPGIVEEAERLLLYFRETWHFSVSSFAIPSGRSQAALQNEISRFIFNCQLSKESLLLVHYGGHGDANVKELRAIWAA
jgi:hypothetical protein